MADFDADVCAFQECGPIDYASWGDNEPPDPLGRIPAPSAQILRQVRELEDI